MQGYYPGLLIRVSVKGKGQWDVATWVTTANFFHYSIIVFSLP